MRFARPSDQQSAGPIKRKMNRSERAIAFLASPPSSFPGRNARNSTLLRIPVIATEPHQVSHCAPYADVPRTWDTLLPKIIDHLKEANGLGEDISECLNSIKASQNTRSSCLNDGVGSGNPQRYGYRLDAQSNLIQPFGKATSWHL